MSMMPSNTLPIQQVEDNSLGHFLYGLMSAFPLFFVPVLLSLWFNLIQKNINPDSVLGSHLRWQRMSIIGLCPFFIAGYWLSPLWLSYRIFKGWISLNDGLAV